MLYVPYYRISHVSTFKIHRYSRNRERSRKVSHFRPRVIKNFLGSTPFFNDPVNQRLEHKRGYAKLDIAMYRHTSPNSLCKNLFPEICRATHNSQTSHGIVQNIRGSSVHLDRCFSAVWSSARNDYVSAEIITFFTCFYARLCFLDLFVFCWSYYLCNCSCKISVCRKGCHQKLRSGELYQLCLYDQKLHRKRI